MNMKLAIGVLAAMSLNAGVALAEGDAAAGENTFKKCKSCHVIANGDEVIVKGGKVGPNLYGIVGRAAGSDADFGKKYGASLVAAGEGGLVWDAAKLADYLADTRAFLRETLDDPKAKSKMSFKLPKEADRANVAAYLATFSDGS